MTSPDVSETLDNIQQHGVIAVVEAPVRGQLLHWAKAVAEAGVQMVAIPVTLPDVTEVVDDLSDEAGVVVGVTRVTTREQISVAFAAGASFVLSPITSPEIISAATERGIDVIAGAATATEIAQAIAAGAEMITVHPVGVLGGVDYFRMLAEQFEGVSLLASGGLNPDNAPSFLEVGAVGAIVDQGVFPQPSEPAAVEVITARAAALMEVCADIMGTASRISVSTALAPSTPAQGGGSDSQLDALIASESERDPFADGAVPLQLDEPQQPPPPASPDAVAAPGPPPPPPPQPAVTAPAPPPQQLAVTAPAPPSPHTAVTAPVPPPPTPAVTAPAPPPEIPADAADGDFEVFGDLDD